MAFTLGRRKNFALLRHRGASGEAMTCSARNAMGPVVRRERTLGPIPSTATKRRTRSFGRQEAYWIAYRSRTAGAVEAGFDSCVCRQDLEGDVAWRDNSVLTRLTVIGSRSIRASSSKTGCSSGAEHVADYDVVAGAIPVTRTIQIQHATDP